MAFGCRGAVPSGRGSGMKTVRIVPPVSGSSAVGTKVLNEDGTEVPGVTSINLRMEPGSLITATVEILARFDETNAVLLLDEDTLMRSAVALGYRLEKDWIAMGFSREDRKEVLEYLESHNRHGKPYQWPAGHDFGRMERAADEFMFRLEQYPPFTWLGAVFSAATTRR